MLLRMYGNPRTLPLVGLVLEGEGDVGAIPQLLREMVSGNIIRLRRPIHYGGQPVECAVNKFRDFVRLKVVPRVRAMILKQVSVVVVVIDRENREQCPGEFAQVVLRMIVETMEAQYQYRGLPRISVVCADRKLENWLIADPQGIFAHNYIVNDLSSAVGTNADAKEALTLLKRAYKPGRCYHKRMDAPDIASKVRTMLPDVRRRSRSLDKLLRECGLPPLR